MKAVDLFAGPGGWDVGARELGLDPLGIEYDDAACATREAAGLRTLQADVAALNPNDFAPCDLLIASPPCQAWSMAGKREGMNDIGRVYELTERIQHNEPEPPFEDQWADERSRLVTEPLRWALALKPRLIAWEQVPPVLDYWKHCTSILRAEGYHAWTGILSAERYGVPQTRKRAILMASLDGPVHPPLPTHQEYRSGEPAWTEPMMTLEGELQPWVSMADALGWNADCPAPTVTGGGSDTGGPEPFGRGGRERIARSMRAKRVYVNGNQPNVARRPEDTPAPTLLFGHRMNDVQWVEERPAPTIVGTRRSDQGIVGRQLPEGEGRNVGGHGWVEGEDYDAEGNLAPGKRSGDNAVRVTTEEAATLQSFPADYPWQGSRSKQFQQIGNAVPPLLARAVLEALVPAEVPSG